MMIVYYDDDIDDDDVVVCCCDVGADFWDQPQQLVSGEPFYINYM